MKMKNFKINNLNYLEENEKLALNELKFRLEGLLGYKPTIILYGSKARGDFDTDSDIDVAIIVEGLTKDIKEEILDIVVEIETKYLTPLSTLILSKDEFERLKIRERRIAIDIENEGIVI